MLALTGKFSPFQLIVPCVLHEYFRGYVPANRERYLFLALLPGDPILRAVQSSERKAMAVEEGAREVEIDSDQCIFKSLFQQHCHDRNGPYCAMLHV